MICTLSYFWKGDICTQIWGFSKIFKFSKILSLNSLGYSWCNSYIKFILLDNKLCFSCGTNQSCSKTLHHIVFVMDIVYCIIHIVFLCILYYNVYCITLYCIILWPGLQACSALLKETPTKVFSYECHWFFKNTFLKEHLQTATSLSSKLT